MSDSIVSLVAFLQHATQNTITADVQFQLSQRVVNVLRASPDSPALWEWVERAAGHDDAGRKRLAQELLDSLCMGGHRKDEPGWEVIGDTDRAGRRATWVRFGEDSLELCAGREGDDYYAVMTSDNPAYQAFSRLLGYSVSGEVEIKIVASSGDASSVLGLAEPAESTSESGAGLWDYKPLVGVSDELEYEASESESADAGAHDHVALRSLVEPAGDGEMPSGVVNVSDVRALLDALDEQRELRRTASENYKALGAAYDKLREEVVHYAAASPHDFELQREELRLAREKIKALDAAYDRLRGERNRYCALIEQVAPELLCEHGVTFPKSARALNKEDVRRIHPRLNGPCPLGCGYDGIAYASRDHQHAGGW